MNPTLPTILRIAMVFSVDLDYFFVPEPKPVLEIVRKGERMRFPDSAGEKKTGYHFESLERLPALQLTTSCRAEFP